MESLSCLTSGTLSSSYLLLLSSLLLLLSSSVSLDDDVATCDVMCECQLISPNQITVHCARKSLARIPPDIPSDVTYLDVSYNNITALDGANMRVFEKLKTLDLRNNLVARIDSWAFQKLSALEELDLDNNLIQTVTPYMFSAASKLKILSLANNAISRIDHSAFIHLSLDSLNLRDNRKLTSLDSATFSQSGVNTLILDGCGLRHIDASLLLPVSGTLRVLSLSNMANGLLFHSGALSSLDLDILQLVGNDLEPPDLGFLSTELNVKSLDLSANKLSVLDLSELSGLRGTESLVVKRSRVREVLTSGRPPPNLADVRELDLGGNALTSFPVRIFRWLPGLRSLSVADNPIASLPEEARPVLDRLRSLDISNVPLVCGCRNRWFADWRNVTDTLVVGDLCAAEGHGAVTGTGGCSGPHELTAWIETHPSNLSSYDIVCAARGNPTPRIRLAAIQSLGDPETNAGSRLLAVSDAGQLRFEVASRICSGYSCTAANDFGNDTITFHVCPSGSHYWTKRPDRGNENSGHHPIHVWILTILLAVVLFVSLLSYATLCLVRRRRQTRFKTRLRNASGEEANPDETTGSHMVLMKSNRNEEEVLNSG